MQQTEIEERPCLLFPFCPNGTSIDFDLNSFLSLDKSTSEWTYEFSILNNNGSAVQLEELHERKDKVKEFKSMSTPSILKHHQEDKEIDSLFDKFSRMNANLTASNQEEIIEEGDLSCTKVSRLVIFLEGSFRQMPQIVPSYLQRTAEIARNARQEVFTLTEVVNRGESLLGQPGSFFKKLAGPTVWSSLGSLSDQVTRLESKVQDSLLKLVGTSPVVKMQAKLDMIKEVLKLHNTRTTTLYHACTHLLLDRMKAIELVTGSAPLRIEEFLTNNGMKAILRQ